MFSLPASVLVFEAFVVLGGLMFCGTFTLHLNRTEAVTSLSLQKINVEKNVVSDLGREQKGREKRFWGICLESGLSSIPNMSLSLCHLYLLQWKVDACCFQTQICHSFPLYSFWMGMNSYKSTRHTGVGISILVFAALMVGLSGNKYS